MQIFLDCNLKKGDIVEIKGRDAAHLVGSLRAGRGEHLIIADSTGKRFNAVILDIHSKFIVCSIINQVAPVESVICITLVQSIVSNRYMRNIIQKAVEMNVDRILPVVADRSNGRRGNLLDGKMRERWEMVAYEAWKQSERPTVPDIHDVVMLDAFFEDSFHNALFIHLEERSAGNGLFPVISHDIRNIYLFVGPEGGFSPKEVALMRKNGAVALSLGSSVLKAETAAIAGLAVTMYEMRRVTSSMDL